MPTTAHQKRKDDAARSSLPEVRIELTGNSLDGELIIPDGANGIVIFAHGSGSSRHSPRNQFVARTIRESGTGTLLFDLLTHDEEIEDQFTGEFRFNIPMLAQRLVETANWVRGEAAREIYGVGFFGSSTGGGAALVAAAELGSHVNAVVSRGGRPDLAAEALPNVQCPTLLLVGERDPVVIDLNQQALERMHCPKELRIIPGATHLFEERGTLEQVADAAADWFAQNLREHV